MDDNITTTGTTTTVGPLPPTTSAGITSGSSTDKTSGTGLGTGGMRNRGTDPGSSMSGMGTGARDTSDNKMIDDSTKLFPTAMGGSSGMGTTRGEGEGNVFRSERSASTSSTSSTGSDRLMGSASKNVEYSHARRTSHGLFEGLTAQKRRNDPESVARRQSLSEQRPPSGFIAKMWDNWVRGVPPK